MTPAIAQSAVPDQVLEFTLGEERYCLDIEAVDEIVKPSDITELPDAPPDVVGIMNLRGESTTLVNPAITIGVDVVGDNQQIIIFDDNDGKRLGWLVDHVESVSDLDGSVVESSTGSEYIDGIVTGGEQFVLWLNSARVSTSAQH